MALAGRMAKEVTAKSDAREVYTASRRERLLASPILAMQSWEKPRVGCCTGKVKLWPIFRTHPTIEEEITKDFMVMRCR